MLVECAQQIIHSTCFLCVRTYTVLLVRGSSFGEGTARLVWAWKTSCTGGDWRTCSAPSGAFLTRNILKLCGSSFFSVLICQAVSRHSDRMSHPTWQWADLHRKHEIWFSKKSALGAVWFFTGWNWSELNISVLSPQAIYVYDDTHVSSQFLFPDKEL